MPRNGQGVYSLPPVYEAVTGETIEAQQHNVPLEDIAADLNQPRSIATGGTGGASATQARDNLSVYSKAETDEKIEGMSSGAPVKETPVDADGFLISDSADSGKPKRVLWSRIKAILNSMYLGLGGGTLTGALKLSGAPTEDLHAVTKKYADDGVSSANTNANGRVSKAGDLMSGALNILLSSTAFSPLLNLRNSGSGDIALRMAGGGRDFTGQHIEIGQRADGDLFLWNGAGIQWRFTKGGQLFAAGDIAAGVGNWVYSGFENSSSTVRSSLRPTTVVAGGTGILFADGNLQGSKWGGGYLADWIEARSYNRTRDYLLSEQVPIGGYVLARFMASSGTSNPQSVGGGDLAWSNVACLEGGRINYGTWAPSLSLIHI